MARWPMLGGGAKKIILGKDVSTWRSEFYLVYNWFFGEVDKHS